MAYSTIPKSSSYFNTKLYTGNATARTIDGIGFQPDWVWGKSRTNTENNSLFDAVRGAGYDIKSDATNAQSSNAGITAFNSDGYVLGTADSLNSNSQNFVTWNWKANGSGSANGDGSINSTVSVDTTSGFSIVSYTGTGANATVGHGLGVAPSMIITKSLVATQEWCVYHKSLGATKYLFLNETSAEQTGSVYWQDTAPTSSVFSIGASGPTNSTSAMIAYCFAEKQGFSKFGSYVGNGNSDGSFVYTGFKPAFVMFKRTSSTDNWVMIDNKRLGYNDLNYGLFPNTTDAEQTSTDFRFDLLSNGFKLRNTSGYTNASGQSYIYMAFGQPIVSTNGDIATAR